MAARTIAAQVEELKKAGAKDPDPRKAAFAREEDVLAAAPRPEGVPVGTVLPDAELLDVDASPRTLGEALDGGTAVLVLYRGAWCPYCNLTLRTYQDELLPALRERGVGLVAVSPQKPDGSLTMKEKHDLEYAVLSDPGLVLARAADVVTEPGEETIAAQLGFGTDLTEVNADGTRAIPMPTVAILDGDRTIRWIDVRRDYTSRSEPAEILAALEALEPRS